MTFEMVITLAILGVAILLFVTEWLRVDVVALMVVVALMLFEILTPAQALAGFSSTLVITIAALFIVGGGVLQTGLAAAIGQSILKVAGESETRLLVVIMLAVALLSGFMSDTGTVAVLLPAIVALAASAKISPSKLLIPLSYGSLLGGAATLIGTPPNIYVSTLLEEEGMQPFGFFTYTPMGIIMLLVGIVFIVAAGRYLLPDYKSEDDTPETETPEELVELYKLPDNLYRLRVRDRSSIRMQSLAEAKLPERFGLIVLEIFRSRSSRTLLNLGGQKLALEPSGMQSVFARGDTVLEHNDVLLVRGEEDDIQQAVDELTLSMQPVTEEDYQALVDQQGGVAEVLILPRSGLVGRRLANARFGRTYNLTVLTIRRAESQEIIKNDVRQTPIQAGDTLLVQGAWDDIALLKRHPRDFVVFGNPEKMKGAPNREKMWLAGLILGVMLVLLIADVVAIATASLAAALLMVLSGCLTMDEAYQSIDWKSIVLIAGMLPMSTALQSVGLVEDAANAFSNSLGDSGPLVVMAGLFVFTSVFTQVLSNTATAVLVAPIGLAVAQELDVNPQAFLMAVAIAASMAFASPVASPVNTLVMGAGRYKFVDYMKIGIPMAILMLIVCVIFLPIFFPF